MSSRRFYLCALCYTRSAGDGIRQNFDAEITPKASARVVAYQLSAMLASRSGASESNASAASFD